MALQTIPRIVCFTLELRKAPKGGKLDSINEKINRIISMVRAKVEHPFRVLTRQFGHIKTRYRGLARNRAQLFTLFALGNLFLVRRRQGSEVCHIRSLAVQNAGLVVARKGYFPVKH